MWAYYIVFSLPLQVLFRIFIKEGTTPSPSGKDAAADGGEGAPTQNDVMIGTVIFIYNFALCILH
jgi:hypothetical protein